ncbi:MAG: DUF58 domain-containing protein [Clostridiales bacterium]|nr:DUF58 domain-containing protein [Clostridiales bacterium]
MATVIDDSFFIRLERAALYVKKDMRGYFGGNHQTKYYGSTVEFADYQEYALGDDIRRIDWNLYSRFEKYFIKLFVDDRQMHIQTFLDCSASMQKANNEKAVFAMRVAAALSFLAVQNMDKTSIMLVKGDNAEDFCGVVTGKNSLFKGLSKFESLNFKGDADLEKAIINSPSIGSSNGLTVIISDFMTPNWKRAVDYLLYNKRQVMLVQVLSPEELDPTVQGRTRLVDYEASDPLDERNFKMKITKAHLKAYHEALNEFLSDISGFCAARNVAYVSAVCNEPIEKLLFEKMFKVGVVK